jgi:hypothetical protein
MAYLRPSRTNEGEGFEVFHPELRLRGEVRGPSACKPVGGWGFQTWSAFAKEWERPGSLSIQGCLLGLIAADISLPCPPNRGRFRERINRFNTLFYYQLIISELNAT